MNCTACIRNVNGTLWLYITTWHNGNNLTVAKIDEYGHSYTRNITYFGPNGWKVLFPGERQEMHYGSSYVWGGYTAGAKPQPWEAWKRKWVASGLVRDTVATDDDVAAICAKYPTFAPMADKLRSHSAVYMLRLLQNFRNHPFVCHKLVDNGLLNMAADARLSHIRDKRTIAEFVRGNPDIDNLSVALGACKYGCDPDLYYRWFIYMRGWHTYKFTFDEFVYSINTDMYMYGDYLNLCRMLSKDLTDKYWHFPKNLKEMHTDLVRKKEAIDEAARILENRKRRREKTDMVKRYTAAVSKYVGTKVRCKGLMAFIPYGMAEFKRQADALDQCLVSNEYMKRVADGKEILVFIYKDGKPYATAELCLVRGKYRLGQFNGDQRDDDCAAKADARKILTKWLQKSRMPMAA